MKEIDRVEILALIKHLEDQIKEECVIENETLSALKFTGKNWKLVLQKL